MAHHLKAGRSPELRQALATVCDRDARLFDDRVVLFLKTELRTLALADKGDDLLQLLPVADPLLDLRLTVARDEQRARLPVHPVRNRTAERIAENGSS